jgi:predicted CoA-binding protein
MSEHAQKRPRTVAVVGASSAPHKFGNKAVRAYLRQGWTVYPVNPTEAQSQTKIEGLTVYPSLEEVPRPIDRVSMYVPPGVGITLLDEVKRAAPDELFLNPGAASDELIARAQAMGLDPIEACSIVDIGERP